MGRSIPFSLGEFLIEGPPLAGSCLSLLFFQFSLTAYAAAGVRESPSPQTHSFHRLPVFRIKTSLYEVQIEASIPPRLIGEGLQIILQMAQ
jgi:hypothetical protein